MINDYNYINGCGCMNGNNLFTGNIDALSVEGINPHNVIKVTNNRAQYYAELALQYKNEAKELRDSAKYYSEQNSDVTKSYVDNMDAQLQLAIDGKQSTLVSGTDIKTINSTSLLGSGNIDVATTTQGTKADTALQPNDNISQLTNDSGYITSSALSGYADYGLSNLTSAGKNKVVTLANELDWNNAISVSTTSTSDPQTYTPTVDGVIFLVAFTNGGTSIKRAVADFVGSPVTNISWGDGIYGNYVLGSGVSGAVQSASLFVRSGTTYSFEIYATGGSSSNTVKATFVPFKKS